MIGRATLIELFHLATGLVATTAVFAAGAWSYPLGHATIWNVGFVTLAIVAGMGVPPIRRAWTADRKRVR